MDFLKHAKFFDFALKFFAIAILALLLPTVAFAFDSAGEPFKGDDSAILKIFWFTDFGSASDASFFNSALPQIELNYLNKGNVELFSKAFPEDVNEITGKASQAAECALVQGKYWEFAGKLFANQSDWKNSGSARFSQYASEIGLNVSTFNSCLDSATYYPEIVSDKADGIENGVTSANSLAIGATAKLSTATDYDSIASTIGTELAKIAPIVELSNPNVGIFSGNVDIKVNVSDKNKGSLRLDAGYSANPKGNFSNLLENFLLTDKAVCPKFTGDSSTAFDCLVKIWNSKEVPDGNYYVNVRVKGDYNSSIDFSDKNFLIDNSKPAISGNLPAANFYSNKSDQNIEFIAEDNGSGLNPLTADVNASQNGIRINGFTNVSQQISGNNKIKFTFTPIGVFSDAKKVDVNISAMDFAGNQRIFLYSFYIDLNAPSNIVDLNASITSGNSIKLTWTQSIDKNSGVKQYNIYRNTVQIDSSNKSNASKIVSTANNFNDSNVVSGTTYYYMVEAEDNAGNVSLLSNQIAVAFELFDNQSPSFNEAGSFPANASYSNKTDQNITVKFTDDVSGIDSESFAINVFANGTAIPGNVSKDVSADGKTGEFVFKPVPSYSEKQRIDFNFSVSDNRGNETIVNGRFFYIDLNKPNRISDLNAIAVNGGISLNWSASIDSNSGISHYNIYRSLSYITELTKPSVYSSTPLNSFFDNAAITGTAYYYVVTAVDNAENESLVSNYVFISSKQKELELSTTAIGANLLRNDTIALNFTVSNNTNQKLCPVVDLNVSSNRLKASVVPSSFCLNAKSQTTITVNVSSGDALDGVYSLQVAVKTSAYTASASIPISISQITDELEISGTGSSACKNGESKISIELISDASTSRKISLRAENGLFLPTIDPSSLILNAGESRFVNVVLHSNFSTQPGNYSINVYAFDETAGKSYKTAVPFTLNDCSTSAGSNQTARFDVLVDDSCTVVDKNSTGYVFFTLRNFSNASQAINVESVSDIPTSIALNQYTVPANGELTSSISAMPRFDDSIGDHNVSLHAWNSSGKIIETACVNVSSAHAIRLSVVENNLIIEQGKFEVFAFNVENIGNFYESISLGTTGTGNGISTTLSNGNISLNPGESQLVYASVSASDIVSLGEHSVKIVAINGGGTVEQSLNFTIVPAKPTLLSIESYPEKIVLNRNGSQTFSVVIRNDSGEKIEGIMAEIEGFSSGITISQNALIDLDSGKTATIELTANASKNALAGMQFGKLKIGSRLVNSKVPFNVFVQVEGTSGAFSGTSSSQPENKLFSGLVGLGSEIALGLIVLILLIAVIMALVGSSKSSQQVWVKG